jgi:hypothetical protein
VGDLIGRKYTFIDTPFFDGRAFLIGCILETIGFMALLVLILRLQGLALGVSMAELQLM